MYNLQEEVKKYMEMIDPSSKGSFDFDDFLRFLSEVWIDKNWEMDIKVAFNVIDNDDSGTVSSQELSHVLTNLGERLTKKEIENIFREGDQLSIQ